jgi:hypothetical protein
MGWMGHAARMGEINAYKSFSRKMNMKETITGKTALLEL